LVIVGVTADPAVTAAATALLRSKTPAVKIASPAGSQPPLGEAGQIAADSADEFTNEPVVGHRLPDLAEARVHLGAPKSVDLGLNVFIEGLGRRSTRRWETLLR
jgi:hypothetical protein